ncbi:hypothetical protein GCM10011577_21460 [Pseudarthrobacter polychromogenes]|uniref:Uncharacterized protein n=1 Tax=Pseudarthrobacter polychromogenes TaxID=1676 RepID=A0ABQ1XMC3_9MICC|nr:hypothetical protein GCM10011577_21460 [Pseudarthrobacter polychromogenes]
MSRVTFQRKLSQAGTENAGECPESYPPVSDRYEYFCEVGVTGHTFGVWPTLRAADHPCDKIPPGSGKPVRRDPVDFDKA